MGFFWAFVYTHLLSILLVSCDSKVDVTQSLIVRVQNDLKPSGYSDVEDWYRSTIKSLNASQNPNISNLEEGNYFLHVYDTVFQGFSVKLTTLQAEELSKRPEILGVFRDQVRQIQTTRSPEFLGLEASGNNGLLNESDWGSNTIIGVIDTGIWPERSSFHDQDLGPVPSHWKGECVPGQQFPKTLCNKKLIGARYFHKGYVARFVGAGDNNKEKELFESARDTLGHGTHTVSTAAGRRVDNASLLGYAQGTSSGIAPKARIAIYKTCWSDGCMESDILAAMDYAVKDGVDVISLSLGAGPLPYDADVIAIASYVAVKKGIVVTAAAGNKVPPAETVTNVAPWITTVGAGTLDRKFPADLTLEDGRVITGSSLYSGDPLPEKTYYPLIYAGDASVVGSEASAAYCMPRTLDKELVHGKIVVCDVGQISSVGKGVVVKESGGIGVITAYVDPYGEGLLADAYLMPGMSITVSERSTVLDYITSSKDPRATIRFRGTQLGVKPAPTVAFFSSRGPNTISRYVLKPDVIAPGVNILAAWPDHVPPSMISADSRQTKFNILSGTSMSCPHVSGIAALLKGVHPDWSPAMIKSAIMTTAYTRDRNGKALLDETHRTVATVWDMGAGHVDPERAVDPGLVYDLSEDDYIDFLCATNYSRKGIKVITGKEVMCSGETRKNKPWDLNYPAISVSLGVSKGTNSKMEITVPRTVTYVCDGASTFTAKTTNPKDAKVSVEPEKMVFTKKGEKGSYLVKILVDEGRSKSGTESGTVTWSDGKHEVTSVVVVN